MKTHLEFVKKHLKDPQTEKNRILWFEELVRVEEKLNAPKYRDSLNENLVQSIQNRRLGRRFTFQQDNDLKHTARGAYRQLCECPWVPQPESGIEPNQIFLEKPENVHLPHPTWKSLRGEEKNGR